MFASKAHLWCWSKIQQDMEHTLTTFRLPQKRSEKTRADPRCHRCASQALYLYLRCGDARAMGYEWILNRTGDGKRQRGSREREWDWEPNRRVPE